MKRRYQGVCRGCGAPTARGGKGDAHESCKGCHPGRSHRPGHATGCAARCATGASDTAGHRRQPTGLAHTPPGAVARHSNAWATVAGRHPPRSSTCTGPGLRPWPTPFQRSNPPTERGGVSRPARYLSRGMAKQPAQRAHALDHDNPHPDGWHELTVANPTFLLERLGSECTDLQGLRELTVNGLDAINAHGAAASGRVVWGHGLAAIRRLGRPRTQAVGDRHGHRDDRRAAAPLHQSAGLKRPRAVRRRQLRCRREGRRRLPQPTRTRIPLLAPRPRRPRDLSPNRRRIAVGFRQPRPTGARRWQTLVGSGVWWSFPGF